VSTFAFTLPSFAKVNLSLRILGRRPDGYHEIRTVMQTVSLHDELHFAASSDDKICLTSNDAAIPVDESNLIVRAAAALRDRFAINAGATIHLDKRIPTRGGLGGGSSNAAIALLGLSRLWEIEPSATQLVEIGAALGADVPFFFIGGCALATGIGTDVTALPDGPDNLFLIVTPNASVSTVDAYAALHASSLTTSSDASILAISCAEADSQFSPPRTLHNDFEQVIFQIEPEIERVKQALIESGASGALLAGSGASVFGIFDTSERRQRALREIKTEAGWRVFPAASVSRSEYLQALVGSCGDHLITL
jgi:4-diphosphocytidyl-2-C-methyl-D-erythritol kinase